MGNASFYYVPIQPQYTGFVHKNNDFRRHALFQLWNDEVSFIHQTKWIEPMDHSLWEYWQNMTDDWACAVVDGQDWIFPLDHKGYVIRETKSRTADGALIQELEQKWIEFWFQYQDSLL